MIVERTISGRGVSIILSIQEAAQLGSIVASTTGDFEPLDVVDKLRDKLLVEIGIAAFKNPDWWLGIHSALPDLPPDTNNNESEVIEYVKAAIDRELRQFAGGLLLILKKATQPAVMDSMRPEINRRFAHLYESLGKLIGMLPTLPVNLQNTNQETT